MRSSQALFDTHIRDALSLSAIYDYGAIHLRAPFSFDDILRAQIANSVSAFDKFMHDLIRIGMIETFVGRRRPTPKYSTEVLSLEAISLIRAATVPPPEAYFEKEILKKHSHLSFQDPVKVADALGLIWAEPQKWQAISNQMGRADHDNTRKILSLICVRRNKIVHEADYDGLSDQKLTISREEAINSALFIQQCGIAIFNLVKL